MESPEPQNVRIITTLGHVDHGKTTLMDALLAANNIISPRMAGKMRYLDSREDEQERGITMESSAVSLKFQVASTASNGVNMVDTPGHVDFSSEVSTASRLCDGALVLVDVVEGVCTQTIAVLRQAWQDRLRPILVINKFDRLITELKLAPIEAYHHLARLIEQVNAVMGSFFASERMEDDLRWHEERERRLAERKDLGASQVDAMAQSPGTEAEAGDEFEEKDDEDIYFAPEKGNVIFASAIDGWGFRVSKFAQLYATKMGINEVNLRKVLWGDYFLDPKTKKVISYKHLRGRGLKPLFVQFVLENIWAVYDAVVINPDVERTARIVNALSLKIPPRDLKSKDTRYLLSLIFTQWLSLSTCIIQTVIDIVPPPPVAQNTRIPKMLYPDLREQTLPPKNKLETDLYASNAHPEAYVAAYVSKMFAIPPKELPENRKKPLTADEMRARGRDARTALQEKSLTDIGLPSSTPSSQSPTPTTGVMAEEEKEKIEAEVTLGFARLYSGTIRQGADIYAVLPKYNTALGPKHIANAKYLIKAKIEGLYVMMGRELVSVNKVKAGNIFAIKGLSGKVWRAATICAPGEKEVIGDGVDLDMKKWLINLGGVNRNVSPIVRVALEPLSPADMPKLMNGLKLLSQSDPCVETFQQQTGEHVILTAGECLKDLRERFARVEIQASKPIVPFRETAVKAPDMAPTKTPNAPRGTIRGVSSHNVVNFTIRGTPIPRIISDFLRDNIIILKKMQQETKVKDTDHGFEQQNNLTEKDIEEGLNDGGVDTQGDFYRKPTINSDQFWGKFKEICEKAGGEWGGVVDKVWAFGPHRAGGCLLVDSRKGRVPVSLRRRLDRTQTEEAQNRNDNGTEAERTIRDFDNHFETGFQLAMFQGPLCAEPVEGMAYFVENVDVDEESLEKQMRENRTAQVTGSLISAVRDACRNGLLDWSPRLMLAMYTCDIQASTDVLGKVYAVIAKRRGRITAEEMKEGTSFFNVTALLPVVESFGLADDIRKRTSGAASPQLIFSGYELLDMDPFWVPTTEEELEDLGEKADRSNIAKGYMDGVRDRKGLFVDRKLVEFAEKQRTLKR
ncbi:hypothetical protein AMATHDRAFT_73571 [Amanita thiersii Skay4041]|uniref:Ribosome assembly protein 1 n=1 Tax=Amanita thiersii Skay4041 TaxID=703135 RepID=A0A2A9NZG7_9AGAR|nr:hypothetical protein AMATHDRAFT_73571 [Amanita thiersii Skay4041]